jgi:NAD(P)-dependent dehydrogenase (short-subunit alcohol dehydrogenase family)
MKLKNRVAIVTGGGQGIGYAIGGRYAQEGCSVVFADIDPAKAQKAAEEVKREGGEATAVKADVTKPREVDGMIEAALQKFGKIDILVNNAGNRPITPFLETSDEEWDYMIRLNLSSVFYCSRRAVPYLEKEQGKIINMASIGGLSGYANRASYCAAKAGVINLTRAMAVELAPKKIRVNCISPGVTLTPLTAHYATAQDADSLAMMNLLNSVPARRWGKPEDIAAAALFLASDEAGYILGVMLPVDGGWSAR